MPTDTPKSSKMTTLEAAIADSDRLDARPSPAAERLTNYLDRWHDDNPRTVSVNLADLRTVLAERERYRKALAEIIAVEPPQFVFPADWQEQIAACPECQGWAKDHPIQRGICDLHRKPLWARESHDKREQGYLIYRAKDIARSALTPPAGGGGETTTAPTA